MMCERALSRYTQGGSLGEKQMVQEMIADSYMELIQFRLLVLNTAWQIDQVGPSWPQDPPHQSTKGTRSSPN